VIGTKALLIKTFIDLPIFFFKSQSHVLNLNYSNLLFKSVVYWWLDVATFCIRDSFILMCSKSGSLETYLPNLQFFICCHECFKMKIFLIHHFSGSCHESNEYSYRNLFCFSCLLYVFPFPLFCFGFPSVPPPPQLSKEFHSQLSLESIDAGQQL
jgi:hypothetical protein